MHMQSREKIWKYTRKMGAKLWYSRTSGSKGCTFPKTLQEPPMIEIKKIIGMNSFFAMFINDEENEDLMVEVLKNELKLYYIHTKWKKT